jgi:hypothetical protein
VKADKNWKVNIFQNRPIQHIYTCSAFIPLLKYLRTQFLELPTAASLHYVQLFPHQFFFSFQGFISLGNEKRLRETELAGALSLGICHSQDSHFSGSIWHSVSQINLFHKNKNIRASVSSYGMKT